MRIWSVVAAALVATGARAQLVETTINATGDNNWSATAGRTVGNGLLGGTARVFAGNALVAQGAVTGPGAARRSP